MFDEDCDWRNEAKHKLPLTDRCIQYKELVERWWLVASSPFPISFCKIILLLLRTNCQILDHHPPLILENILTR